MVGEKNLALSVTRVSYERRQPAHHSSSKFSAGKTISLRGIQGPLLKTRRLLLISASPPEVVTRNPDRLGGGNRKAAPREGEQPAPMGSRASLSYEQEVGDVPNTRLLLLLFFLDFSSLILSHSGAIVVHALFFHSPASSRCYCTTQSSNLRTQAPHKRAHTTVGLVTPRTQCKNAARANRTVAATAAATKKMPSWRREGI
ncbi:hypothetical protein BCR34DRAFT_586150 [Clohesyomyces aquaticus]|uniref:Uncharacterized protein n=1 Tax=Clohesyomyces aquaticus TaxID=1231657 RepID=A0A1Y1ZUJ3_9PLEO|nr:hypothetical protein BCR34DRAFT_586150 [Clohesyomyces aquaticus]